MVLDNGGFVLIDHTHRSMSTSTSSSHRGPAQSLSLMDTTLSVDSSVVDSGERRAGGKGERSARLPTFKGQWKSFIEGLQRVLIFSRDSSIIDRINADDKFSQNIVQVSLTLKSVGLSLVDNAKRREVAYIGITQ